MLFFSISNQITQITFLLSHHHSTSALVSEILMSVLQTVQKNNRQFTYGQTVQKNNKQFTYGQTVQKTALEHLQCSRQCKKKKQQQFTYRQTVQKKQQQQLTYRQTVQKKQQQQFTYGQTVQKKLQQFTYGQTVKKKTKTIYIWTDSAKKNYSNLHMDRQCKKTTAIYIWTVHIYRLYRRQCAKYTYMHSVRLVYYRDILNYQRHIIHRMGTSTLCTVSIHNVVYT